MRCVLGADQQGQHREELGQALLEDGLVDGLRGGQRERATGSGVSGGYYTGI